MALIFPRLANNFIKNGYFPTDQATLERIVTALDVAGNELRILDPCCGEGAALHRVGEALAECGAAVQTCGVEFDAERAWHAKTVLDLAIHADIQDVVVAPRSMGLLFLNPPYGDAVADRAQTGDKGPDRLEKIFFRRTFQSLAFGGVLVLIVPYYVLDAEFAGLLARNFDRLRFHMAPEQQFKQCVVFGVRRRSDRPEPRTVSALIAAGKGEAHDQGLPECWTAEPYAVPEIAGGEGHFHAVRIDAAQLAAEVARLHPHTLWPQFRIHFGGTKGAHRPPLTEMGRWHLALALAAGQAHGIVSSGSGRTLLIKGDTYKDKVRSVELAESPDGSVSETVILTDRFVPVIRGIDFTPGSGFGSIVTIQ
ncbi:MAG: DUF6094 domain-containing protein [Aromatoleum sp.]|jgi:hypothetical protein|uniref:DUF6094 domain-containing protein n=1 Tax=Aromatoleum sp. TaxID=2307007 RepID=UPI002894C4C6|nr:DUF6094 domain-containing protein [Aromatoleum sp.]MDT3671802.1 DUF6094 domain-containing protein [Aromatoleum sp.]